MSRDRDDSPSPEQMGKAFEAASRIIRGVYDPVRFRVEMRDRTAYFYPITGPTSLPVGFFDFGSLEFGVLHRGSLVTGYNLVQRITEEEVQKLIERARGD